MELFLFCSRRPSSSPSYHRWEFGCLGVRGVGGPGHLRVTSRRRALRWSSAGVRETGGGARRNGDFKFGKI